MVWVAFCTLLYVINCVLFLWIIRLKNNTYKSDPNLDVCELELPPDDVVDKDDWEDWYPKVKGYFHCVKKKWYQVHKAKITTVGS